MPRLPGDETFHRALSGFLYEWTSSEEGSAYEVHVRAERDLDPSVPRDGYDRFDVAIVGAGPGGLAAAVYGSSEGCSRSSSSEAPSAVRPAPAR